MARLFFALALPPETRARLCAWRAGLPLGNPRWSRGENLHLTLSFLGEQEAAQLPRLLACAEGLRCPGFTVSLEELHYWKHADVLVLSPRETPEGLLGLVAALQERLDAAGIAHDRKAFRPHVTLARHCSLGDSPELDALAPRRAFVWQAREFGLYQSLQGKYLPLASWPLSS